MGKLISIIPDSRLVPGSALRLHVELLDKPRDSTSVHKALPGTRDIST